MNLVGQGAPAASELVSTSSNQYPCLSSKFAPAIYAFFMKINVFFYAEVQLSSGYSI